MNTFQRSGIALAVASASLLLTACATAPTAPVGADLARQKLAQLQADPQLATRAPVAMKEAEAAVAAAEQPRSAKDMQQGAHLVFIADRKVDIAQARAQARLWEDQREQLSEQREDARLDSRTLEADLAHQETQDLKAQIAELNARETERGLVITLGDLLFETDRAELRAGTANNLDKLAAFLNRYPDRNVIIEGYTDNIGSDDYNFDLSQRRAESVRGYLMSQGIATDRMSASGKGEGSPVASNSDATGRQMNRRVEILIINTVTVQN
jgi:outer membrane protein OmpA-like peptidoglycan-associated protein